MRMPADEFFRNAGGNIIESERLPLCGQFRVKDDLQQHVTQFLPQVLDVAGADRIDAFMCFLNEIADQRLVTLLGIPRTTAGRAQSMHNCPQPVDLQAGIGALDHLGIVHARVKMAEIEDASETSGCATPWKSRRAIQEN
jgi:hypothetical protein